MAATPMRSSAIGTSSARSSGDSVEPAIASSSANSASSSSQAPPSKAA